MPGQITTEQAVNLAKALLRGDQDRIAILKTVISDKVREVI
jgi:pyruvate dehydrogenase (quinone)